MDLGDVVDLLVDLVADETGLGDQVGLDGPVDGGGGDGDHGGDGVVGNSDGGGVGNSDGGGVGNSDGGSSDSGSGDGGSGDGVAIASAQETVAGVASSEEPVASQELRGGHAGADEGRKDNKGVHLAES